MEVQLETQDRQEDQVEVVEEVVVVIIHRQQYQVEMEQLILVGAVEEMELHTLELEVLV